MSAINVTGLALGGAVVLLIALATVAAQVARDTRSGPAHVLRTE